MNSSESNEKSVPKAQSTADKDAQADTVSGMPPNDPPRTSIPVKPTIPHERFVHRYPLGVTLPSECPVEPEYVDQNGLSWFGHIPVDRPALSMAQNRELDWIADCHRNGTAFRDCRAYANAVVLTVAGWPDVYALPRCRANRLNAGPTEFRHLGVCPCCANGKALSLIDRFMPCIYTTRGHRFTIECNDDHMLLKDDGSPIGYMIDAYEKALRRLAGSCEPAQAFWVYTLAPKSLAPQTLSLRVQGAFFTNMTGEYLRSQLLPLATSHDSGYILAQLRESTVHISSTRDMEAMAAWIYHCTRPVDFVSVYLYHFLMSDYQNYHLVGKAKDHVSRLMDLYRTRLMSRETVCALGRFSPDPKDPGYEELAWDYYQDQWPFEAIVMKNLEKRDNDIVFSIM